MDKLARIPQELHPCINQIAQQLYWLHGYTVADDYDFSMATHPHEVQAYEGAIAALEILQDYSMDTFGTDLTNLIDESEGEQS